MLSPVSRCNASLVIFERELPQILDKFTTITAALLQRLLPLLAPPSYHH